MRMNLIKIMIFHKQIEICNRVKICNQTMLMETLALSNTPAAKKVWKSMLFVIGDMVDRMAQTTKSVQLFDSNLTIAFGY